MRSADQRYDLIAIGGGTAALVATLGVAGLGGRAALIEAERTGGDCLWTGCVPSKALLAAAAAAHAVRDAPRYGVSAGEPTIDFPAVMATVHRAQQHLAGHDSPERLAAGGVTVLRGHGRFVGPGRVAVGDRVLEYRSALIATGAVPYLPPMPGLDLVEPLTTDTLWELDVLPRRLLVLGGGPIGCELGQAFARLGATVSIVEAMDTLLPREHHAVGRHLAAMLNAEGVGIRTGRRVVQFERTNTEQRAVLDSGEQLEFDRVLVAIGRTPSTGGLDLETVGVEVDAQGNVVVGDDLRTSGHRIFAAGDVTGLMPFTHVAAAQARLVVSNALFGTHRRMNYEAVPWATFTDPEVGRVGLDASGARRRWGSDAVVQRFDYDNLDRAVTDGHREGWVELIGDPKRRLVGATIVGHRAAETLAELTTAVAAGSLLDTLSTTIHTYPTYSEGPARAADEVLRQRLFAPRVTRMVRPFLAVARWFARPR